MPVIGSIDTTNRWILLAAGVRSYHPVNDIYKEIRALRRADETLRRFEVFVTAAGNVSKGGGKFTPRFAIFRGGWRVVPEDVSHVLSVTGEQLTEEGGSGAACFDLTPLSATSKIAIQYEPPAAEIIEVSTGGVDPGDLANAVWAHADAVVTVERMLDVFNFLGLEPSHVVEHGQEYIRCPADGSHINIAVTKVGNKTILQRV